MDERSLLRRQMRASRRALSAARQRTAAAEVAHRVATSRPFRSARSIAFYLPADGEIDPRPLLELAAALGRRTLLPVLAPLGHGQLWFRPWRPGEPLRANRFGIPEPTTRQRLPATAIDLVLLPLVAFDRYGNRLGMGGGFYDRSFAFLRRRQHWHHPTLIGLAHEIQRVERLPSAAWDVPLDAIVSDAGWYHGGGRRR